MRGKQPVRWRRVSLRTLMLVMSACCVVMGVWSIYVQPYRDQAVAFDAVARAQGIVDVRPAEGSRWHQWLVTKLLGPERFVRVVAVELSGKQVDDALLRVIADLIHLERLGLDRTTITDEGTAALVGLERLHFFSARYTPLTDASAEVLSQLGQLRTLYLTGTGLSDEAIPYLRRSVQLQAVYLRWTDVTDDGAVRLAMALPQCSVYHHALETN